MKLDRIFICLFAFVLVPICSGAGAKVKAKTKAKTKDPWDSPEDGQDPQAAGSMDNEMSPEDQAGVMQELQRRSAVRRAQKQHAVMKQFMKNFANNMRLAVLADSRGDMPEAERQRLIAKAQREKGEANGEPVGNGMPGVDESGPPPEDAEGAEEMQPPPPRRRMPRRSHMLNMAAARHRAHHTARLLPEAEGIGFPPPEGMAPDPGMADDQMTNDPGMTRPAFDTSGASEEAPEPRPQPRRHHLRMLNMRPHERRTVNPVSKSASGRRLPPGIVRDEMGRAMPLLFQGPKPAHSGALRAFSMHLGAAVLLCFFLSF